MPVRTPVLDVDDVAAAAALRVEVAADRVLVAAKVEEREEVVRAEVEVLEVAASVDRLLVTPMEVAELAAVRTSGASEPPDAV